MFLFVNRIFVTVIRKGLIHNALIQKHGLCQDRIKLKIAISAKNLLTCMKKSLKRLCFNIFRSDLVKWLLSSEFIAIDQRLYTRYG